MDECCIACLSENRQSFAGVQEKERIEEFIAEKLPPVFANFPVILCNGCSFQLEKYRNFRQNVLNSINTLTAQLNKIYGCRVFVEPLPITIDPIIKEENSETFVNEFVENEIVNEPIDDDFDNYEPENDFDAEDSDASYEPEIEKSTKEAKTNSSVPKTKEKYRVIKPKERKSRENIDPYCNFCKIMIKDEPFLFHLKREHFTKLKSGFHKCKICDQEFKAGSNSGVTYHFDMHREFKTTRKCSECKDSFKKVGEWRKHIRNRHTTTTYECLCCEERHTFVSKRELMDHLREFGSDTEEEKTENEEIINESITEQTIKSENTQLDDFQDKTLDEWGETWQDSFIPDHTNVPKNDSKVDYRVQVYGGRTRVHTVSKGKTTKWHQYIRMFKDKLPSRHLESKKRAFIGLDVDCSICGLEKLARNYRAHVISTHAILENDKVFCKICNTECTSQQSFVYHFDTHRILDPPKKCEEKGCDEVMNNMKDFKRHTEAHRYKKEFQCPDCDNQYFRIASLQFHYMTVHTGALMCRFCQLVFELKEDYDRHIKAEYAARKERKSLMRYTKIRLAREKEKEQKLKDGVLEDEDEEDEMNELPMVFGRTMTIVNAKKRTEPLTVKSTKFSQKSYCHICRINVANFKSHVTDAHSTRLPTGGYKCNVCHSCLKDNFSIHFYQNHREYPEVQQCEHCDFSSIRYEVFRKHQMLHKRGLFECHYCGLSYTEKTSLRYHMFFKHTELFICNYCMKTFDDEATFKDHMVEEKGKRRRKTNVCDICGFTTTHSLKSHMTRKHGDQTEAQCEVCGKKCKSATNLRDHMLNVHTERTVACPQCDKKFRNHAYMREHVKITHTTETVQCQMCEKVGTPFQIKRHFNFIHETTKPFQCKICHITFKMKSGLQKHLHSHAGTRPFNCHVCSQGFYNRNLVQKHLLDRHNMTLTHEEIRAIYRRMPSTYEHEHFGQKNDEDYD
ncbi:zinc finger protein 91-like [Culicoides brevitarsis]|uniref:zinc finger protein 91-like n=1 Tax=Culicoides brevitarsis TaxID=469753 RepID=UPI00307B1261